MKVLLLTCLVLVAMGYYAGGYYGSGYGTPVVSSYVESPIVGNPPDISPWCPREPTFHNLTPTCNSMCYWHVYCTVAVWPTMCNDPRSIELCSGCFECSGSLL